MIIRKFKFTENGPIIANDGEFLHINDIELLLISEKTLWENCLETEKNMCSKNEDISKFKKEIIDSYKTKVSIINSLLEKIRKGNS